MVENKLTISYPNSVNDTQFKLTQKYFILEKSICVEFNYRPLANYELNLSLIQSTISDFVSPSQA